MFSFPLYCLYQRYHGFTIFFAIIVNVIGTTIIVLAADRTTLLSIMASIFIRILSRNNDIVFIKIQVNVCAVRVCRQTYRFPDRYK